jgi:hypothetical protein
VSRSPIRDVLPVMPRELAAHLDSEQFSHRPRRFIGGRPRVRRHGKGDHPTASRWWWRQRCRSWVLWGSSIRAKQAQRRRDRRFARTKKFHCDSISQSKLATLANYLCCLDFRSPLGSANEIKELLYDRLLVSNSCPINVCGQAWTSMTENRAHALCRPHETQQRWSA